MSSNCKPPRADEAGRRIDIEGIDAPPEAVARALLMPRTKPMVNAARKSIKDDEEIQS